jgi:hypothetical protein
LSIHCLKILANKIQFCYMIWLWTTVVIHGHKCSSFVAFPNDDTDLHIFCVSHAKGFLGDVSNLALFCQCFISNLSSLCSLLSKMEPVT